MAERASNLMRHHYSRVVAYDLLQKLPVTQCHEVPEVKGVVLNISRTRAMNDAKVSVPSAPLHPTGGPPPPRRRGHERAGRARRGPPARPRPTPRPTPPPLAQLLLLGRTALTLLTGKRTEMRFTTKFKAGKSFRIFKGLPVGVTCRLARKDDVFRYLQLWRNEILPDLPREYEGAGISRAGNVSTGMEGPPRLLQEISESFDRFRGFAWNGSVAVAHRIRHLREGAAALVFTGLGIPIKGRPTREVAARQAQAAAAEQ